MQSHPGPAVDRKQGRARVFDVNAAKQQHCAVKGILGILGLGCTPATRASAQPKKPPTHDGPVQACKDWAGLGNLGRRGGVPTAASCAKKAKDMGTWEDYATRAGRRECGSTNLDYGPSLQLCSTLCSTLCQASNHATKLLRDTHLRRARPRVVLDEQDKPTRPPLARRDEDARNGQRCDRAGRDSGIRGFRNRQLRPWD